MLAPATVYALAGAVSVFLLILGRPAFRAAADRAKAWAETE